MTSEKLYHIIEGWKGQIDNPVTKLSMDKVLETLQEEMRKEAAKASGKLSVYKAASNVLKEANNSFNDILHGVFMDEGRYCLCDSYRAVRFVQDPGLPKVVTDKETLKLKNFFNLSKYDLKEIKAPSIADLLAFKKTNKVPAGKGKPYCVDADRHVYADPQFLADMLGCLPGCKVYVTTNIGPIYFVSEDGDAICLPVRWED